MNFHHRPSAYGSAAEEITTRLGAIAPKERVTALLAQHADDSIRSATLWAIFDMGDQYQPQLVRLWVTMEEAMTDMEERIASTARGADREIYWIFPNGGDVPVPMVDNFAHDDWVMRPVKIGVEVEQPHG